MKWPFDGIAADGPAKGQRIACTSRLYIYAARRSLRDWIRGRDPTMTLYDFDRGAWRAEAKPSTGAPAP